MENWQKIHCVNLFDKVYCLFDVFSDFTIKVVKLEDNEQKCFKGHQAPILSVALDPKDVYLVSIKDFQQNVWSILILVMWR